jgi:DNA mismatch repair protein MutS2
MEFSLQNLRPTYRLILDVPGQSYGLEVAEQIGLPNRILLRAKELKKGGTSDLNQAVTDLMTARDEIRLEKSLVEQERFRLEGERLRWEQEIEMIKENRNKVAQKLKEQYEAQLSGLRQEFDETMKSLKGQLKTGSSAASEPGSDADSSQKGLKETRQQADQALKKIAGALSQLSQDYESSIKLPGESVEGSFLKEGEAVYVLPLKKPGSVLKMTDAQTAEVKVGVIKLRVSLRDLRRLSAGETPPPLRTGKKDFNKAAPAVQVSTATGHINGPSKGPAPSPRTNGSHSGSDHSSIGHVIQTHLNTLDLRGMGGDEAVRQAWDYLDRALLRGEEFVLLLHGHGEGVLKQRLREALRVQCPYDIDFRPGQEQEGGDGVTVVRLNR